MNTQAYTHVDKLLYSYVLDASCVRKNHTHKTFPL